MNSERLINFVRMHVELYDTNHPKYSDKRMKNKAWNDIGRSLNLPATVCKKSWINLRDSFRRAVRHKKLSQYRGKPWKYEVEMSFLIPYLQERKSVANEFEEEALSTTLPEPLTQENIGSFETELVECEEAERQQGNSELDPLSRLLMEKPSAYKRQKTENSECESVSAVLVKYLLEKRDKPSAEDALTSFFSSICATVRSFPLYYQSLAKTRIFSLVSELEMKLIQQPVYNNHQLFPRPNNTPLSPTPSTSSGGHHNEQPLPQTCKAEQISPPVSISPASEFIQNSSVEGGH